ncbi:4647_t:CDS:2, partial [Acaulospora colombiana]
NETATAAVLLPRLRYCETCSTALAVSFNEAIAVRRSPPECADMSSTSSQVHKFFGKRVSMEGRGLNPSLSLDFPGGPTSLDPPHLNILKSSDQPQLQDET